MVAMDLLEHQDHPAVVLVRPFQVRDSDVAWESGNDPGFTAVKGG
jgi:hypothetical protein